MHPNYEKYPYNDKETRDMINRFIEAILKGEVKLDIDPNAEFEIEIDDDPAGLDEIPFCEKESCDGCPHYEEEAIDVEEEPDPLFWGVPDINKVIFSDPATVIFWADGEKTVVKCAEGQTYDRYSGFCAAVCKRLFGSSSAAKEVMEDADEENWKAAIEEERRLRREAQEEIEAKAKARKEAEQSAAIPLETLVETIAKEVIKAIMEAADETPAE